MIKNLGQIAGLWIGNTSPQNRLLIWFDTGNNVHKTYDYSTGTWIPVSMNPIINKTYSELQNLADLNSISQGTFYRITDLGYLALAITSTKIQYTDNNDNFIIDDLISTKTYCVTSSNLLIEDKGGVWDVSTNTLKFNFEDTDIASDPSSTTADDYILGTKLRSSTKKLSKYKLSSLISGVTGNAISWNKGFFLNFLTNLRSYYDVNGGVVRYTTYTAAINNINQALNTLQQNINNLNIWNKTMPSPFNPPSTPTNMVANDTLKTLLQKAQAWINKFKNAKGIVLSSDYAVDNSGVPAVGDTVEQAIGKIQYEAQGLPSNWNPSTVSSDPTVAAGDTFAQAFAKVQRWFDLFWHISTTIFSSKAYSSDGSSPLFIFNSTDKNFKVGSSSNFPKNSVTIGEGRMNSIVEDNPWFLTTSQTPETKTEHFNTFKGSVTSIFNPSVFLKNIHITAYSIYAEEPEVPKILHLSGPVLLTKELYAIYGDSLKTGVRSSEYLYKDSYQYDAENTTDRETFEINENTPEFVIFRKVTGTDPDIYLNFTIGELREGQIISILHKSPHSTTEFSINLITNSSGNGIVTKEDEHLVTGGISITFSTNTELKFIALPSTIFGGTNGLCLVQM